MHKELLLGDEVIAQAGIDAGMSGIYGYLGTPSTEIMEYVQRTAEIRSAMGLPIRDTKPTPVGNPIGLVPAVVMYLDEGALELHIEHVESTSADKRANYGVKIVWDVFPMDASLPDDPETLRRSAFTRRKKELLTFGSADRRKTAVFCLHYENSKGKAGQWGSVFSAVIP
jgi:hypothetical protein